MEYDQIYSALTQGEYSYIPKGLFSLAIALVIVAAVSWKMTKEYFVVERPVIAQLLEGGRDKSRGKLLAIYCMLIFLIGIGASIGHLYFYIYYHIKSGQYATIDGVIGAYSFDHAVSGKDGGVEHDFLTVAGMQFEMLCPQPPGQRSQGDAGQCLYVLPGLHVRVAYVPGFTNGSASTDNRLAPADLERHRSRR